MISTGLRQAAILFAAWHLAAPAFARQFPVERPDTLKVALVSGSHSPAYLTDQTLAALKDYLEENYPMTCLLLTTNQADNGFINIESLDEADTAVFFVRRKTPDEQNMAVLRRFFDSGKGFVALRPTSHAWENWTSFDTDVLGAKYEGTFDGRNPMQFVYAHPHPIFTGAGGFQTRQYMYQYGAPADDVHVIMQGRNASGTTPLAWTREHKGGRVFHLVPSHVDDFANPDYLRIIAHGILWVTRQEVPGAQTAVVRGIMPESYPGAFAVVFPQGPSLCFDPVRGGINYIWEGTFIDFRPNWTGKVGQAAAMRGDRFYEEDMELPLRRGNPDHVPEFHFQGYRMQNGFPVFQYRIDDCVVREELRPLSNNRGIVRHFQTNAPGEVFWLLTGLQDASFCSAQGGEWRDGRLRVVADESGAFAVTVRRLEGVE